MSSVFGYYGGGLSRSPQILAYLTARRMDKFKKRMEARKLSDKVQKTTMTQRPLTTPLTYSDAGVSIAKK